MKRKMHKKGKNKEKFGRDYRSSDYQDAVKFTKNSIQKFSLSLQFPILIINFLDIKHNNIQTKLEYKQI